MEQILIPLGIIVMLFAIPYWFMAKSREEHKASMDAFDESMAKRYAEMGIEYPPINAQGAESTYRILAFHLGLGATLIAVGLIAWVL